MASSLSRSALAALLPALLEERERREGENGALLPFLKCICWAASVPAVWAHRLGV